MKKLNREEEAVLVVLYEVYPLGLSEEEIDLKIKERGLIEMTKKEFTKYARKITSAKKN